MIRKNSIRVPMLKEEREPLLALLIGVLVASVVFFALFGCRDMPTTATALDAANKALVGLDVALDATVEIVKAAREDRVAVCRARDLPTKEERTKCLGALAEPLGPKAEAAAMAYDAAVRALADLSAALEPLEKAARETGEQ